MPDDMGFLEKKILDRLQKNTPKEYCHNCGCDNCIKRRIEFDEQHNKMTMAAVISAAL